MANSKKPTRGKINSEAEDRDNKYSKKGNSNKDQDKRDDRNYRKTKGHNSPDWYAASPQLLIDSASLAYSWPTGTKLAMQINTEADIYKELNNSSIPGVMSLEVLIGPGKAIDNTDPVNMAARNIYSFVRHANAGHTNYDAPDLMLYLLAMDNAYSFYAYLVRLYGCLQLYTQTNRYYPRALVEAMGVYYESIILEIADLRYFINSYGYKLGMFAVPATMSYFVRHQWMFSNLYVDSTSSKAQTYLFTPCGYHKFVETEGPGRLDFVELGESMELSDLVLYGNAMLDAIAASEDMNIMSGDILKAYGSNAIFKVAPVDENYYVLPVYDPEVISQIQNATVYPGGGDIISGFNNRFNITQDVTTGALQFKPFFLLDIFNSPEGEDEFKIWEGNRIISMYKDDLNPGDNMVATRLTSMSSVSAKTVEGHTYTIVTPEHFGSEIIVGGKMYYYHNDVDDRWSLGTQTIYPYAIKPIQDGIDIALGLAAVTFYESFDNHPMAWIPFKWSLTGSAPFNYRVLRLFNINNYTILDDSDLRKMHQTALLSEFNSPQIAKAQPSNYR